MKLSLASEKFVSDLKITHPLICGAMYPCSNPELVAAVSKAGGIGIVQPLSFMYVHGHDLRKGLQLIKSITANPFGFNVLTEQSSKVYQDRMKAWVNIALEEGCRFFITALGNPKWIVEAAKPYNAVVYHDVTEKKWAQKAVDMGVHGLICVNNRAGGHAGTQSPQQLFAELSPLGLPLVCAGGVGDAETYKKMLEIGYAAVQMGTRFIATTECLAHPDYKQAILKASSKDIVLTEKLTGVPVSVINSTSVQKLGTKAGKFAKFLLKHPKLKHYMRLWYTINSFRTLKKASLKGLSYKDFWQAGKSVDGIKEIESAEVIVQRFTRS